MQKKIMLAYNVLGLVLVITADLNLLSLKMSTHPLKYLTYNQYGRRQFKRDLKEKIGRASNHKKKPDLCGSVVKH